jgi:acyl-CoA synthetase (AMP-forming)/AMP-acid ligase II
LTTSTASSLEEVTVAAVPIPDLGYPATLAESIKRAARLYGERDFLVLPHRRMTFAEAERASAATAKRMLEAGIGKGTRVGLYYTYSVDWVVAWLAASRIGALVMPFSTIYAPGELRTVLRLGDVSTLVLGSTMLGRDTASFLEEAVPDLRGVSTQDLFLPGLPYLRSIWMTGGSTRPWARPVSLEADALEGHDETSSRRRPSAVSDQLLAAVEQDVVPGDLATVVYTSGSSALPKGVVHTHGSIVRTTASFAEMRRLEQSAVFCAFPFFWIGGFLVLGGALNGGFTVCCLERFEPEAALDMVEKEACGLVAAWPSLIQSMRTHPTFPGRNLQHCPILVSGPSDIALTNTPVPGIPGHRGMSETVGNWDGVERKIVDPETGLELPEGQEGELLIRGYGVTQGYYKKEREEVFDADGWLHTGDRCFVVDNRPFFIGRFYEMIKTRGANVSPREVELVLEALPDVAHALVFGLPHPDMEEEVVAVVVPAPGVAVDPESIRSRARRDLSSYKVPTRIEIVPEENDVPWLASGKPDKLALRARFAPSGG